eukprot:4409686-Pleurochrysis_carterae.AAC.3
MISIWTNLITTLSQTDPRSSSRRLNRVLIQTITDTAAPGRALSDTVARTESFKPNTPELACTGYLKSLLGSTLVYHPDRAVNHLVIYDTTKCGQWSGRGCGGG